MRLTEFLAEHLAVPLAVLLAVLFSAPAAWADDVEEGKVIFRWDCFICHYANDPRKAQTQSAKFVLADYRGRSSLDYIIKVQNAFGPDLRGVFGSPAGRRSKEGYAHSKAFVEAAPDIVWTEENLDKWLTDTRTFMPGTMMTYWQPDPEKRRKVIAWLKTYK